MAAVFEDETVTATMSLPDEDEDLSDDQIQTLLKEAEQRLRLQSTVSRVPQTSAEDTLKTNIPQLNSRVDPSLKPCIKLTKGGAEVNPEYVRQQVDPQGAAEHIKPLETSSAKKERLKKDKEASAGPQWFNLPKTVLTPELKRDLQLLRLRSVLDPKRHYKKEDSRAKPPPFSQVGTIIESPVEYFSARLSNKERKKTLTEEVLAGEKETGRFKRKYAEIQAVKTSGKKASWKIRKAKRAGRR
ncbi:Fcf2 pre-rRNA processing-domain-containing protein [Xylogone sp. PMI_703]|nr:Fcf2 pre-rRNA processing-domain-containing protein [Xylogone sp. PMI_703]